MSITEPLYRQLGRPYDFSSVDPKYAKRRALDLDKALMPDENAMSASAVISTPTPDRVSDSMKSEGCKLDNYRKNPVVFWEHGCGGITIPIAKCEHPDGRLAIDITSNAVLGTSYFTDKVLESEQIFELIVERIIRATSIRFDPLKMVIREENNETFYDFLEWDLEEWSWVTVPCNPEAVNGVISKGRLAGRPIVEPILKSLQARSPERAVIVRGWGPEPETRKMADKTAEEIKAEADAKVKAEKEAAEAKEKTDKEAKEKAEREKQDKEMKEAEKKALDFSSLPYGQQFLHTAFKAAADLTAQCEASIKPLENAKVKEGITEFLETLKSASLLLEGTYSEAYPEASPMAYNPSEDNPEEVMKSFLSGSRNQRLILKGLGGRIKGILSAENIKPDQRKLLDQTVSQIERMIRDAEAVKVAAKTETPEPSADVKEKIKAAMKSLSEADGRLENVLPFQKNAG